MQDSPNKNANREIPSIFGKGLVFTSLIATVSAFIATQPAIAADWIESVGGHAAYNDAGQVVAVDFRRSWVTDSDLAKLAQLTRLERIDLSHTKISDEGLEKLIPLQNVGFLNLHYAEYVSDLGVAHLKHWTNLKYLNLRGTKVTSHVLQHVSGMRNLRTLDIGHSRVNDDSFEYLVNLEQLESLSFGGNKMNGTSFPQLRLLPKLRELSIAGKQRTDSGLWSVDVTDFNVDHIARLSQLESLDLSGSSLSDRGIAKLSQLRALRKLDLSRTDVTADGIAALSDLRQLRHLKLSHASKVSDQTVPHLLQMQRLEIIELHETAITMTGLSQFSSRPTLRQLFIGGIKCQPNEIEQLRAILPNVQISGWPRSQVEVTKTAQDAASR